MSQQLFDINDITLKEDLLIDLNFDIIPELQPMKPSLDSNKAIPPEEAAKHRLHAFLELIILQSPIPGLRPPPPQKTIATTYTTVL